MDLVARLQPGADLLTPRVQLIDPDSLEPKLLAAVRGQAQEAGTGAEQDALDPTRSSAEEGGPVGGFVEGEDGIEAVAIVFINAYANPANERAAAAARGRVERAEMEKTFNMGVGMVAVVSARSR